MKVSPLELRQQRFRTILRGFDKVEVTSFLMAVADDYEHALREADRLRQEVARMEVLVSEHREQEKALKSTLLAAQKLADDIKANADEEGRRIVSEAESRSLMLSEKSQARLDQAQREIENLKMKRKDVETSITSTIQTLRHALDYIREQDSRNEKMGLGSNNDTPQGADVSEDPDHQFVQGFSS